MLHIHVLNKLAASGKMIKILKRHLFTFQVLSMVDRRFAVKARLSGILTIVVGLLKKFQEEQDKLLAILKLLQSLSTSSKNTCTEYVRRGRCRDFV